MRRYQNRNRDMMGYGDPAPSFAPPQMPSQLDSKDERLLELSAEVGRLTGQNDLLAEDNGRLEEQNEELRRENKELRERNRRLESEDSERKGAVELVDEIEEALSNKKKGKK